MVYPTICRVSTIQGDAGFLPSTVGFGSDEGLNRTVFDSHKTSSKKDTAGRRCNETGNHCTQQKIIANLCLGKPGNISISQLLSMCFLHPACWRWFGSSTVALDGAVGSMLSQLTGKLTLSSPNAGIELDIANSLVSWLYPWSLI